MADPMEFLTKSQAMTVKLANESLRTIRETAVTGVTAPEQLLKQVNDLAGVVTGLAGATAQPLQDFIQGQREFAEAMAAYAGAQAKLAELVADMAEKHAATVTALEQVTAPLFGIVGAQGGAAQADSTASSATSSASKKKRPDSK